MEGFAGQKIIVLHETIITDFLRKDLITKQLYITDIGYYPNAKFHYMERLQGATRQIIIYYVQGSGWVEINNKRIDVNPSQLVAIPAHKADAY